MIKRILLVLLSLTVAVAAVVTIMYVRNTAPAVAAISASEAANPTKPFVVKLHAQWCPICMTTRSIWSQIDETYSTRVNLLIFDFTNDATTAASRVEAKRVGLETYFDETGATG